MPSLLWPAHLSTRVFPLARTQMVLAPRWSGTRRLVRSPLVLAPLALVYGLLLAWSWQPDTFSLILPGSWAEGLKGEALQGFRAAWGRAEQQHGERGWTREATPGPLLCRQAAAAPASAARSNRLHFLLLLSAGGWNPQFMPSLAGICTLFSRWATAASLWVHLLAVNLFAAREMYLEGARSGCVLCCWFSPVQGLPARHAVVLASGCVAAVLHGGQSPVVPHTCPQASWRACPPGTRSCCA